MIDLTPTKPKKIYISGPITGLPELNVHAFSAYELELTRQGHFAVNPHNVCSELVKSEAWKTMTEEQRWAACMDLDIVALGWCDEIHFLRGWEFSRGALIEKAEAEDRGMVLHYVE